MSDRYFIDTNVCLYGFGRDETKKNATSVLVSGNAIASGLNSDCGILYTEDLQHGQIIEGKLKVVNPFIG